MNLPKDYQSKMQEMLGEEYLQYLDSFNHSYGQTLRVNQLKDGTGGFYPPVPLADRFPGVIQDFIMRENRNYPHTRIIMQESIICRSRVRWRRQRFYR